MLECLPGEEGMGGAMTLTVGQSIMLHKRTARSLLRRPIHTTASKVLDVTEPTRSQVMTKVMCKKPQNMNSTTHPTGNEKVVDSESFSFIPEVPTNILH